MDFLKDLFGEEALTWEQFSNAVKERGFKVADLATGDYVSKHKFDDELSARDNSITELKGQLSTRDSDIKTLKKQLEDGGKDSETKVSELTEQLSKLQTSYDTTKKDYEARLSKQSYEFAVREFANEKSFSSNAAKRDFINEMLSAELKMKDNTILGAEDFVTEYLKSNEDAFTKVSEPDIPEPPKPSFGQPTPPQPAPDDNAFINAFNFTGVRPKE